MDFPTDSHGIVYRKQALELGLNDNRLRRAVERGELHRIWPGAYLTVPPNSMNPRQLHLRKAVAASVTVGGDVIISHQSAAVLHGMEMLLPDLRRVHQTSGRNGGGRRDNFRQVHGASMEPGEIMQLRGVTVTSPARTAVDIARTAPGFAHALAVLDAALRMGVDPLELEAGLSERRKGVGQARLALQHADGLSENPGESWGRAQLIVAGLPGPELQRRFFASNGKFIARCDYAWGEALVGEFDGRVKYLKELRPGDDPTEVILKEKQREDAIRRLGTMVIRWIWDDLVHNRVVPVVAEWLDRLGILAAA